MKALKSVLCLAVAWGVLACSVKPGRLLDRRGDQEAASAETENETGANASANPYNAEQTYSQADCSQPATLAGPRRLRLLSNAELRHSLKDLFGIEPASANDLANDVSKHNLFDHIGSERPVHLDHLKSYLKVAEEVGNGLDINRHASCPGEESQKQDSAEKCLQAFLTGKGAELWRRPLTSEETTSLASLFRDNYAQAGYDGAMRQVVAFMVFSPNFLYRFELGAPQSDGRYRLTSWELASALSYLVWRSVPDETLRQLAANDSLQTGSVRKEQLQRMLKDEKAKRAVGDFSNLWTRAFKVRAAQKEATLFPNFSPELRQSLAEEVTSFYKNIFFQSEAGKRSFKEVMTATYTWGREDLVQFYGATAGEGGRLELGSSQRRQGLFGKAGFLAGYSYADASSPIHRGVFVLENVLCRKFPDPPAVVVPPKVASQSNRDRFAAHATNAVCASCHKQIDQVGFSMEGFNAIGQALTDDAGGSHRGELMIDGNSASFSDGAELADLIAESKEGQGCHATQWYRFAFGQKETLKNEQCYLDYLGKEFSAKGGDLHELLATLVSSDFFIYRMNQPAAGGTP